MYEIIIDSVFKGIFKTNKFIEFGDLTQVINFIQLYEHHSDLVCSYTISFKK